MNMFSLNLAGLFSRLPTKSLVLHAIFTYAKITETKNSTKNSTFTILHRQRMNKLIQIPFDGIFIKLTNL